MDLTGTQGLCPSEPALAEIACPRVDAPTQFILQRRQAFLLRRIFGRWEPNSENPVSRAVSVYSVSVNRDHSRRSQFDTVNSTAVIALNCFCEFVVHLLRFSYSYGCGRFRQFIAQAGTKKERRMAESQAPPLQLNQFVPYLTGSPPSRQECRYPHYKTIYRAESTASSGKQKSPCRYLTQDPAKSICQPSDRTTFRFLHS